MQHSPVGASSASRWMACPGSVTLIQTLGAGSSDDDAPDYQKQGTAAHAVAASCLTGGLDAWEFIGETVEGVKVGEDIANGVQVYLEQCRPFMEQGGTVVIEEKLHSSTNPLMFGTVDFAAYDQGLLIIRDYKHGAGVVVEAEDNTQLKYYALLLLEKFPLTTMVSIGIVQPNAFHKDGPVRTWETSARDIIAWGYDVLMPAMNRVHDAKELQAGEHCRFCPAKLICPTMKAMYGAATKACEATICQLDDDELAREYQMISAVKMYCSNLEKEMMARLRNGKPVPGFKLVNKRADRVWRDEDQVASLFGDQAYVKKLKTPAMLEKEGDKEKQWVRENAFTPESGLTVVRDSDTRPSVKHKTMSERYEKVLADEVSS